MTVSNFSLHIENSSQLDDSLIHATQESTEYFVLAAALVIIMLLAIFGNTTLIVTILHSRKLRTRTNMFILNLACADVGVALLCIPFSIITCFSRDWIFGDILCQLNGFMNIFFESCSLFTLTAISIEKYFSIVKPLDNVITRRKAWVMIAMTWIAALTLASMPLTGFIAFNFKDGSTQCGVQVPVTLGQTIHAFVVLLVVYLIPLCIMGFCYVSIFMAASKHSVRMSRMSLTSLDCDTSLKSQRQIAVTIFILFVVFCFCWTPYFVYMLYMTAKQVRSPDVFARGFGLVSYLCVFLNSCIDPFVYGVRNPLIRKQLCSLFCVRRKIRAGPHQAQSSGENFEPYLQPPQTFTADDNISCAYPAFINLVALSAEDIIGPNQGIPERTMNKGTQTEHVFQTLSIHDLHHGYFTTKQGYGRGEALGNSMAITCSTCSSACSEVDFVNGGTEKEACSLGSDAEFDSLSDSSDRCSCEDGRFSSSDDRCISCASIQSRYTNSFSLDGSKQAIAETPTRVSLSTTEITPRKVVLWIESQL